MIKEEIVKILQKVTGIKDIVLDVPGREEFGDYSTNAAMVLAKKEHKNPHELAEEIVEKINKAGLPAVASAKAGFINFYLSKEVLLKNLEKVDEKYGSSDIGKTVVIDYSSPNIAKAFGVGHLRSTIIGQALYNLYQFLGYKTIGDNHLGDWGTQFGMIIAAVKSNKLDINKLSVDELEKIYVDYNKQTKEDPKLRDVAKEWFKKLEEGDKEAKYIWQKAKDTSLAEFQRVYDLLGVNIDYAYGESFYLDKMDAVVKEARKKGLARKSEGAEIVEFDNLPPAMLVKSDGATTYFTRDLTTIKFRMETWKPDIYIYEVGSEQSFYFKQLFSAVRLFGWIKDEKLVHIGHGLFLYNGKKMSTRKGGSIKLEEVLKEAIKRAGKLGEEGNKTAAAVGIGAIKYYDLLHHPTSNINFDWEKVFVLEGNSGPYLQYTVARVNSVLAKSTFKGPTLQGRTLQGSFNREELTILRSLVHFPEVIQEAAQSFAPNLLCNYLYDLASKFNTFYNRHKIIKGENDEFRLVLTAAVGQTLKTGLNLLGIQTPERM
ncbi:MAG: arginine--tRNA ligase [bacterium]|nr:arginine--tRNA ligase [bacterium]